VAVEKLTSRNRVRKHRARMSHKRFSLSAYTFLVTHFESVFRKIDFFNSHRSLQMSEADSVVSPDGMAVGESLFASLSDITEANQKLRHNFSL